jgi:hypothetical protein
MFLISIAMGRSQPVIWTLMFKTQEKAQQVFSLIQDNMGSFSFEDDYGQNIYAEKASVISMMLENAEMSKLAHIERGLHEQRIRAAIVSRMQADPTMRNMGQGPAMLTPMMGGR